MKWYCKVVGHQRVQAKRLPDRCKVTLKGTEVAGLKVEFMVAEDEREQFPYGATFELNGTVQQKLNLPAGNGAEKAAKPAKPEKAKPLSVVPPVESSAPSITH